MKKLIICLLSYVPLALSAQTFDNDTLTTTTGFKIYRGIELKLGTGSLEDGDFAFIRKSATSMFAYSSTTGYQGLANRANSLPRTQSGLKFKVKDFYRRGSKKNGFVYYPKIQYGLINYEIDVENAIKKGELDVPEEFQIKKKPEVVIVQQGTNSVADELTKIKKLYDDGVLTKEEYEAQKKKLLEK